MPRPAFRAPLLMNWWKTIRRRRVEVGAASHVGQVRAENEDTYGRFTRAVGRRNEHLFVVADGMGGHVRGEVASRLAVEAVEEAFFAEPAAAAAERLRQAFEAANARVFARAQEDPALLKMGTTCTALALVNGHAYMAHVGDSRAYRIDADGIEQLTHDHTLVEELRRQGVLSEAEARTHPRRHALTRALGVQPALAVDVLEAMPVRAAQAYLLCSDGLAPVPDDEIRAVVQTLDPQAACERLVELTNARGGPDNVTVLLVRID